MATQASQKSNFISAVRSASTNLLKAVEDLKDTRQEWDSLMTGVLTNPDFIGDHEGLTVTEISSVVGTTLDAIDTLFDAGHYTNLYQVKQ